MAERIKVLHLFDRYLPHTMNWAYRMLRAVPDTAISVASPVILRNEYFHQGFAFWVRPLQRWSGWLPPTEWTAACLQGFLVRVERYVPLYKCWLEKHLSQHRPDLIHAHFAPAGCHYLDLAKRLDIPLIVSFYGYDYESLPARSPAWQQRYYKLFAGVSAITAAGNYGKAVLIRQGAPGQKITVLPMSMNPAEFPFLAREKIPGRLRLLQVATLTEKKGFMDTLQALYIARQTCPDIRLTLAGEKHDRALVQKMETFVRANALQSAIEWLDFVPHDDLPALFARHDVFIQPSHYATNRDCEGGPVSILEAQSSGMPVIATTHFDIPSAVLHGQTGLLAPEHNPAELARHIERFCHMADPEFQQFSAAARRHIETGFNINLTAQKLFFLYQSLITHHS